jgi:hypothetical protein
MAVLSPLFLVNELVSLKGLHLLMLEELRPILLRSSSITQELLFVMRLFPGYPYPVRVAIL